MTNWRFPRLWLVPIFILIVTLIIDSSAIYLTRSFSNGFGCLQSNATRIDLSQGKAFTQWNYVTYNGQRYRAGPANIVPQRVFVSSPAFTWVKNGKRTAHLDYYYSPDGGISFEPWIIIDSPDENIHLELPSGMPFIPYYSANQLKDFVWSESIDGYSAPTQRLTWSPDGHYLLYEYYDGLNRYDNSAAHSWHYSLFGVDGSSMINLAVLKQDQDTLSLSRVIWSADSRFLIFPQSPENIVSWAFDTVSKRYQVIGKRGVNLPADSKGSRVALPEKKDGKTTISLVDLSGDHVSPLIESADDAGDPSWSPDGQHVAVAWATGQGGNRVLRLTWANADGSEIRTIADGLWDVHDLHWMADGESLAYVAQRANGTRVEIVNLDTVARRQLSGGYQDIEQLEENSTTGTISYWWQVSGGKTGIDTYGTNGSLIYHKFLTLNVDGLEVFRSAYRWSAAPEIFRSPDGRTYAVRVNPNRQFTYGPLGLELIAADGSWSRLVVNGNSSPQNPYSLGEPVWSPDSKMIVVGEYIGYNSMLTVLRADGTQVSDFPSYYVTNGLAWTQCT